MNRWAPVCIILTVFLVSFCYIAGQPDPPKQLSNEVTLEAHLRSQVIVYPYEETYYMVDTNLAPFPPAHPTGAWYIDRDGQVEDTAMSFAGICLSFR